VKIAAIHERARAKDQAVLHYTAATKAVYPARAKAEGFLHLGRLSYDDRQDEPALRAFSRAVAEDPTYADAYFRMALAQQRMKQRPEALASYAKVLELRPDDAPAQYNVGTLHEQDGDLRRAVAAYQKAIERDPSHALASQRLIEAALRLGDFPAAEREGRRRLTAQPDDAGAMVSLAMALASQVPERAALVALLTEDARAKESLDWLERGVAGGYANRQALEQSPYLRRLREQSGFAFNRILSRVGPSPPS